MRTLTYAIDTETGQVISRMDSKVAIPVLQYGDIKPENGFQTTYKLEEVDVIAIASSWHNYKWTRKIPISIKNAHRKFWGFKPLKPVSNSYKIPQ
jgi:hypothetical protein